MLGRFLAVTLSVLTALLALHTVSPAYGETGRIDEFGTECYRFSLGTREVNLRLTGAGELPQPPAVANGLPSAVAPRIAMVLDTSEDGVFRVGADFKIRVQTSTDAYLQVIDIGTSGTLTELFPRSGEPLLVKKGVVMPLEITIADSGGRSEGWKVQGPLGKEWILAFATSAPVSVPATMMTTARSEESLRVARLQELKESIKKLCQEQGIDVGFIERSADIVGEDKTQVAPAPVATPAAPPEVPASSFPPERCFALCVGINKYQHISGLGCAVPDATAFHDKLVTSLKIPGANVHLLTDSSATRKAIDRELKWLASAVGPDGCAYVYWAGHGAQALPPEGGEGVSRSGLVPHDFDKEAYDAGKPTTLLYDTELGNWIDNFRKGAPLVMVVDTCFSGAITRAASGKTDLQARGFFLLPPRPTGARSVRYAAGKGTPLNTTRPHTLVFEAAQFDQQAWEDRRTGHGLMTRRLLDLFDEGLPAPVLFQKVLESVREGAAREGETQVPFQVDTMGHPRFVPFRKN
ncbi:MAG: caspase family protein [Candidatus Riflebacteria bacterium]|nr:caspase family protein [Candidatus Riflebacteria bacterium]